MSSMLIRQYRPIRPIRAMYNAKGMGMRFLWFLPTSLSGSALRATRPYAITPPCSRPSRTVEFRRRSMYKNESGVVSQLVASKAFWSGLVRLNINASATTHAIAQMVTYGARLVRGGVNLPATR
jgi:hypothetical protein